MSRRRACLAAGSLLLLALPSPTLAGPRVVRWMHLSTKTGDLQPPNAGDQQTSAAVADFDGDGVHQAEQECRGNDGPVPALRPHCRTVTSFYRCQPSRYSRLT